MNDPVQPRFERLDRLHRFVNLLPEIYAGQRRIVKLPVWTVEDVSMVHHLRDKADAQRMFFLRGKPLAQPRAEEDGLPRIGVAHPLVKCQHASKFRQVLHLVDQGVRQEVVDGDARRVARKAGAIVPSGFCRDSVCPQLQMNFGMFPQKLFADIHDCRRRRRDG